MLVGWHRHIGLGRDFGRQQGRPPAGPGPAPLSLSHRPHAVMRGSPLSGPFLSFLLLIRDSDKYFGVRLSTPPPPLPLLLLHLISCSVSHTHTYTLTGVLMQLFWFESGHTTVLSVSVLSVKVPPLSSLTDQVCEESTLDLILTQCGVVLRMVG